METYKYEVTIGIPVYGVEKYIRKCMESALSQTFQDIEFILVDDRGSDKSVDILREIQKSHPRGKDIRIITQPQNMGCWAARNAILKEAQSKYIFLMDSDDYISSDCIELLHTAAEKYNAEATLGSIEKVDDMSIHLDTYQYQFRVFDKEDEFASFSNLKYQATVTNFIWNILIRTDFIRAHHLVFPQTKFWDDVLFNARFQPLITRAVLIPDITYFYVIRDNSLSSYESRNTIKIEEIRQHLNNHKFLKEQCKDIKDKPYFEMRCAKEMLQTFYTVVGALRNKNKIYPPISKKELKNAMKHPIPLSEILKFKKHKLDNLLFYSMGALPTFIAMWVITIIGKQKKLL